MVIRVLFTVTVFLSLCIQSHIANAQQYKFYVAAESDDEVYRISFDADKNSSTIENIIPVGELPTENEGPHGIGIDPDGEHWYVSLGHGMPFGHLYKYDIGSDRVVDRVELGMFPATLDVSDETGWVYIVNFNLHGPHDPSSLSIVDGKTMEEIERIETGVMPHGSRLTTDGRLQYHVSMMTDELYEIDAVRMEVSRVLDLTAGGEAGGVNHDAHPSEKNHDGDMDGESHAHQPVIKPTWATPDPARAAVYVAGNGNNKIYVVDTDSWTIADTWDTSGRGPYNLEPTHDGAYVVVTYKEGAVGVWDANTGEELAKIKNSRGVTHGVTISPDDRFAFISVEGVGGEPGSVDIIDLETLELVDVVEIGKQASGIAFWKIES